MTVQTMKESLERVSDSVLEQKSKELFSTPDHMIDCAGKVVSKTVEDTELETDGYLEKMESVGRRRRRKECVHNQVLRIREEDSHLGEDKVTKCDSCGAYHLDNTDRDRKLNHRYYLKPPLDFVVFSRPILPCSPLSGKATRTATFKALQ